LISIAANGGGFKKCGLAKSITSDFPSNLKPIDDFFVFCDILQRENLELIGNGNNNLPSSTPL
jgi:hypothetical protein